MAIDAVELAGRADVRSLKVEDILDLARRGALRIPPFQRPPRWRSRHVVDLFDSIVRGYPLGSLLLATREAPAAKQPFGPLVVDAGARADAFYVVDGQQRINALVGALLHPSATPSGDVHAIWYDLEARTFFRLTKATPPPTAIPLRALGRSTETLRWLRRWPLEQDREDLVDRAIEVGKTIREFSVSVAVVAGDDERPLREIFRRLNNFGVAMKASEVFNALFESNGDTLDQAIVRLCETGFGELGESLFLQCMLSVEGLAPDTKPESLATKADAGAKVARTEAALRATCRFMVDDVGIAHVKLLPYALPMRIVARYFALHPKPSSRARTLLRRWVWRGIVSGAFSNWSLATVRKMQALVQTDNDECVARALLEDLHMLANPSIAVAQERWNPQSVPSLIVALALMHRAPRDPRDGVPFTVDDAQMMLLGAPPEPSGDEGDERESDARNEGAKRLSEIVVDVGERPTKKNGSLLAARVVLRDASSLSALAEASPEILADHLISPEAAVALREASHATDDAREAALLRFEALRAPLLQRCVEDFLSERCDLGGNDRISIRALREEAERGLAAR